MGHYVHLNVCFACDTNDAVAELAKKHMPPDDGNHEARWFLQTLAERTGANPRPKAGLCTWGIFDFGVDFFYGPVYTDFNTRGLARSGNWRISNDHHQYRRHQ